MDCNNIGTLQLTWGVWGGGDFDKVCLRHCSEKSFEKEIVTTEEFLKAPDLYEFLNQYCKHNPIMHDPKPCRFSKDDTPCDFSQADLQKVDNSLSVACNCRCSFCFKRTENNPQLQKKQLKSESWENSTFLKKAYLDTFYRLKGHKLRMLRATDNGEPLLYKKELLEFLKGASVDDFLIFGITSNGELLDKDFIDKLNEYSCKGSYFIHFQVSLNAFFSDTRKQLMNSKRDIEEIKELLIYMKKTTGFYIYASMVVMPDNVSEVTLLNNWCKENRIGFIVSPAYNTKWADFGKKYETFINYN